MRLHRSIRNWIITLPKKDSRNYITSQPIYYWASTNKHKAHKSDSREKFIKPRIRCSLGEGSTQTLLLLLHQHSAVVREKRTAQIYSQMQFLRVHSLLFLERSFCSNMPYVFYAIVKHKCHYTVNSVQLSCVDDHKTCLVVLFLAWLKFLKMCQKRTYTKGCYVPYCIF